MALYLSLDAIPPRLSFTIGTIVQRSKNAGIVPVHRNHLNSIVTCFVRSSHEFNRFHIFSYSGINKKPMK